jgi:hypothetical protein
MSIPPVKTAVIGCGTIRSIYLKNCTAWDILGVVACADIEVARGSRPAVG